MPAKFVPEDVIIADSTVLINFIETGRFDLLLRVFEDKLHITDIVRREVKRNHQALSNAISSGKIVEHATDLATLSHLTKSFSSFDPGEASCLMLAEKSSWRVATDDRAAKTYIAQRLGPSYVISTFDILITANNLGHITKPEALAIVAVMDSQANFQYSSEVYEEFVRGLR